MSQRITIDPVTRIEGHLRIDCEIEEGKVVKAWSSGTMWRGMEEIVKGNDPRDAWMIVQRICGVCTTIHALASVRAVENALGMEVPVNAQYIRNIISAAHSIHDHIVHFYQLSALDWVDVTSALKADPQKAADMLRGLSQWPLNSAAEFLAVQNKIKALVDSGQLGIFANGYWGHPAMTLPPGGYLENGKFRPITTQHEAYLQQGIEESGKHAWYQDDQPLAPWEGLTRPNYTGWQEDGKYSGVKAPTFYGKTVEMGPLAWLQCSLQAGHQPTQQVFSQFTGMMKTLTGETLTAGQLESTLGRVVGRTVHACVLHQTLSQQWQALVTNIGTGDHETFIPPNIPATGEIRGVGFIEAPRGALSHWVVIKDGKIANYQAVVPSTWNAGPRNFNDEPGPYERALVGTPVSDPAKPLEVVRTIHSFDPCMSCAVHIVDATGGEVTRVKVL